MTARPYRRARRAFWTLVVVAVLLTGALGRVLEAPPNPWSGIVFAALGVLTVATIGLATRLLLALTGRLPRQGETKPTVGRTGKHT